MGFEFSHRRGLSTVVKYVQRAAHCGGSTMRDKYCDIRNCAPRYEPNLIIISDPARERSIPLGLTPALAVVASCRSHGLVGVQVLKLSSRYCFELAPKQFENFFVLRSVTAGTNNGERIAASLVRFREEFPWDLATRALA